MMEERLKALEQAHMDLVRKVADASGWKPRGCDDQPEGFLPVFCASCQTCHHSICGCHGPEGPAGPTSNFIDPTARIGIDSSVWHFAVVLAGVIIGERCSIGSRAEIGAGTVIGDGSRIGSGVFLSPRSRIGRGVFIGPNTTFTDDRKPRAGNSGYLAEPPVVEDGASIGAGCVILPGVRIGAGALIGAGSVVARDVAPGALVRGERAVERPYAYAPGFEPVIS